jgi:hypothetical protein
MGMNTVMVKDRGGMVRESVAGDGFMNNVTVSNNTTDTDYTITVADIAGGVYQRSGTNTSRTETLPTNALLIAAFPNWDIGQTMQFQVANATATNPTTIAVGTGGTGGTLVGVGTVPVNSSRTVYIKRTAATTYNAYVC